MFYAVISIFCCGPVGCVCFVSGDGGVFRCVFIFFKFGLFET